MTTINKKITLLMIGMSCVCILIVLRLCYLQIYCADYFLVRSHKNFTRYETSISPRGNICDIHGNLLATNKPVTCVMWQGTGKGVLSVEQYDDLKTLEKIIHHACISGELYEKIVRAERKNQRVVIASDIDFLQLSQITELFAHHANIVIDTQFKRFYPYNSYASHVIGYLGNVRLFAQGQSGLEKIFDEHLSGHPSEIRHVVNSSGQCLSYSELEKGLSGIDVQTTIDIEMQELCEKVFPSHYTGCFVLLNPLDGSVVSLVSRPCYDPNVFVDSLSLEMWKSLQENNPFVNRAFDAQYPSGSIFKLITISAALEQQIITTDTLWNCKGYTLFGNRKYWCGRKSGHGEISIEQAVATSCNTLFFEIGKQIDIDLLADYAYKFGLGEKTQSVLPEKSGLVPTKEWKFMSKGEPWWPGETLSVTIGQSFLLVTPIQIARMIASIFTGYLVSPRLLVDEPICCVPLDIRDETLSFLKKSMKMVVRYGTGRTIHTVKDIKIYGKTSTAQISDLKKRNLDPKYLEHGWFVAHFQYKDYAPLVLLVMVEHAGTAHVATTIAKDFLVEYKKYMDR